VYPHLLYIIVHIHAWLMLAHGGNRPQFQMDQHILICTTIYQLTHTVYLYMYADNDCLLMVACCCCSKRKHETCTVHMQCQARRQVSIVCQRSPHTACRITACSSCMYALTHRFHPYHCTLNISGLASPRASCSDAVGRCVLAYWVAGDRSL